MVCGNIECHVVTSFLLHKGLVLLLRRSAGVSSYQGKWAAVSGSVEPGESYEGAAYREIAEETGITASNLSITARGDAIRIPYGDFFWVIHPFLFECSTGKVKLNWENTDYMWATREELSALETVPMLADALDSLIGQ